MSSKKLVGKCGLFCGACSIYRAERDSEEWRKRIATANIIAYINVILLLE